MILNKVYQRILSYRRMTSSQIADARTPKVHEDFRVSRGLVCSVEKAPFA